MPLGILYLSWYIVAIACCIACNIPQIGIGCRQHLQDLHLLHLLFRLQFEELSEKLQHIVLLNFVQH